MKQARATVGFALAWWVVAGAGCGLSAVFAPKPDPSRFFVLAPLQSAAPGEAGAAPTPSASSPVLGPDATVGLGPVDLPDYLRRSELVIRRGPTEIEPVANELWGEPLERNVARVLGQNLAVVLGIDRVVSFPWYSNQVPTYQVRVDFHAFEPTADGAAVLEARWEIRRASDTARVNRESTLTKPVAGPHGSARVAALSAALADLSREIATALRELPAGKKEPGTL